MTLDVETMNQVLLAGCGVLLVAVLAVRVSVRAGLPSLLLYLFIGVALGDAGVGIAFTDAEVANALGIAALVVILAEGGLTTSWSEMRPVLRVSIALATIGVAVSVGVVAVFAHYVLGLDWQLAVLLGAITSPTDSAAVFSVLRRVPLPHRLTTTLEAESGLNDPPSVVLVTLVAASSVHGPFHFLLEVVFELTLGVLIGVALGFAGAWLLRRAALPASGLYPLTVLTFALLAYASSAVLHGSGIAGAYVAALILGNSELPHRAATRSFAEGMAWLAQIGLFVMLGLLVSPGEVTWKQVGFAVAAGLVLTYVARPLAVLASAVVKPMPWPELAFISWAGLRGAVPIVLATIPLSEGVEGAEDLFNIVFVIVVIYTLLTGPTLPWAARVLQVARRSEPRDLDVEAAPLERIAADLLMVTISPKSLMHGVEVAELRLPKGSSVSLIVRDGSTLVPQERTVLRHGDELLVVTTRKSREKTEQRLRAVSHSGRLAQWLADP
jgi:cell volume regulation protein A